MSVSSKPNSKFKRLLHRLVPPPGEAEVQRLVVPSVSDGIDTFSLGKLHPHPPRQVEFSVAGLSDLKPSGWPSIPPLPDNVPERNPSRKRGGFWIDLTISAVEYGPVGGWQLDRAHVIGVKFDSRPNVDRVSNRVNGPSRSRRSLDPDAALRRLLRSLLPMLLPPPVFESGVDTHFAMRFPHPLYAFQRDGVEFLLRSKEGALLADDMGLGKTVQAIVALRQMFRNGQAQRVLVVAPAAVVTSWLRHFQRWAPELHVASMQTQKHRRHLLWQAFAEREFHVAVAPYDSYRNDVQDGQQVPEVDVLIADEVQKLKNPSTKRSRALQQQSAKVRWGLTGTPLENSLDEFATVLRFCGPKHLPGKASGSSLRLAAEQLMLRRKKEAVLSQLPDVLTNIEYVRLSDAQRRAYDEAAGQARDQLSREERSVARVRGHLQDLKQICNGVNGSSAKLDWLIEYMKVSDQEGDKLLVFSYYLRAIAEIEDALSHFHPLRYTGSTSSRERDQVVDTFQRDGHNRLMVLQVIAGSTGITLHAANRVVHFDSWWNPAVQSQATARAHRIGQTKTVFETTLVAVDTVEERIQALLEYKRQLFSEAVDDLSVVGLERMLSVDEMYSLFDL